MTFKKNEIDRLIEEETQLPRTHRRAFEQRSNDVAQDADGQPTLVPSPENPEDRFQ
jgi:hypothetical protein